MLVDDVERELLETTAARVGVALRVVHARVWSEVVLEARPRQQVDRHVHAQADVRAEDVREIGMRDRSSTGIPPLPGG